MTEQTTTNLEYLLNALDSRDEQTRADAIRQVRALSLEALLTLAGLEVQHFRRYRYRQWRQAALLVFTLYAPLWYWMWRVHSRPGFVLMFGIYMPIMMYVVLPNMRIWADGYSPSRARRSLAAALEEVEEVSFIPAALTLLQDKTKDITPVLIALLKRLLPKLHAGDAQTWTSQQVQALLKLVSPSQKDTELLLCVLKALEQIGDARAIPYVEALGTGNTRHTSWQVQRAATECLPYLQQRAGEQRQAQTLLRPTQPSTTGENLLRPITQTTPQMPDEQLLRPQQL